MSSFLQKTLSSFVSKPTFSWNGWKYWRTKRSLKQQWQPFWSCFAVTINTNTTLITIQKLNYLCAQLRGEASRVITGLPLTNINYTHSVELLKEQYGQSRHIVCAQIPALLDILKPINNLAYVFSRHHWKSCIRCSEQISRVTWHTVGPNDTYQAAWGN